MLFASRFAMRCGRATAPDRRESFSSKASNTTSGASTRTRPPFPALWGGRLFSPTVSFDPFGAVALPMTQPAPPVLVRTPTVNLRPDLGIAYQLQMQQQTAAGLQRRLAADVRSVEAANAGINQLNGRAPAVLSAITTQNFGADPEQWKRWWTDRLGYAYQPSQSESKPTYTSFVTEPLPAPIRTHNACFGAGTLVKTADGLRTIESIEVGDRLLSQNTTTGTLEFRPVLAVYHNKPAATLRLSIGGDPIVSTGIHRFWKAGKGWTMAHDLKAGDRLRMVGGVAEIRSIEPDAVQPVFNVEVAGNRDYFVGKSGMLVHDNSFVQPVLEPFDRESDLAALRLPATPLTEGSCLDHSAIGTNLTHTGLGTSAIWPVGSSAPVSGSILKTTIVSGAYVLGQDVRAGRIDGEVARGLAAGRLVLDELQPAGPRLDRDRRPGCRDRGSSRRGTCPTGGRRPRRSSAGARRRSASSASSGSRSACRDRRRSRTR